MAALMMLWCNLCKRGFGVRNGKSCPACTETLRLVPTRRSWLCSSCGHSEGEAAHKDGNTCPKCGRNMTEIVEPILPEE